MIRVLHFIHGLNTGGAETIVKDYALGFDKEQFSVSVLCYEKLNSPYEKLLQDAGIRVVYVCDEMPEFLQKNTLPNRVVRFIMRALLIRKHIRILNPDVLHIHLELHSLVRIARPRKSTALVYTQHFNTKLWTAKDIGAARWLRKRYRYQSIALTQEMKQKVDSILETNDTVVVKNGVDFSRFRNAKSKEEMRNALGIAQDAFVVGHVGRLDPIKNHKFLIEVFDEIQRLHGNGHLILIGSGAERENIVTQIKELGLSDRVSLLSNRTDIPDLLHAADVFVFPSFSEGVPISVIEAQASELTCVVSEAVPAYAMVSNNIFQMSLQESAKAWAERALYSRPQQIEYYDIEKWDVKNSIRQVEGIYRTLLNTNQEE